MIVFRALREWLTWRVARRKALRRWRDIKVLLVLVLVCLLCQVFGLACGVVGYGLRWLGILPEDTTSPVGDAEWRKCDPPRALGRFQCLWFVPALCKSAVMV